MNWNKLSEFCLFMMIALVVSACGGGGNNSSPGSVVVVEEVEVDSGSSDDEETPDEDDASGGGTDGSASSSVIPERLSSFISVSGLSAIGDFDGLPIFTIYVSALEGGALDPAGLVLGNDAIYEISGGALRVTSSEDSCSLDLLAGAVLAGSTNEDFLVIEQGCSIVAEGTVTQPIVLTAMAEVNGEVEDSDRGLWGGLVINGFAPINDCPEGALGGTAECTKEGEANSGTFGGANPEDSSGVLRYVSVRFAGSNVDPENQLNGIAFQGVGSGTTVEYVQVHNNLDDGIEFFGGNVDAKYVVLTGNADDSLDWTDGWQGRIQYLYIEQTDSADNGIEADNREGDESATPVANPSIANMTIIGNSGERALRIRRGTGLTLSNSFIDGSERCIRIDGSSRDILGASIDPTITFQGVSLACATTHDRDIDGAVEAYLNTAVNVSQNGDTVEPVSLADTFFANEDFIGAIGATDWTAGSVSYTHLRAHETDS